ncbi:MAG: glycosyltransferase, partial [Elusimicrobia bacterium]|nr:glycosyltransferase [Elusimicrobiota bacterium]
MIVVLNALAAAAMLGMLLQLALLLVLALSERRRKTGAPPGANLPSLTLLVRGPGPFPQSLNEEYPGLSAAAVADDEALREAVAASSSELIGVLDAEAELAPGSLAAAAGEFADPRLGGCGAVSRERERHGLSGRSADLALLCWSLGRMLFARLGWGAAVRGPLALYRRSALLEAGALARGEREAGALLSDADYRLRVCADALAETSAAAVPGFRRFARAAGAATLALAAAALVSERWRQAIPVAAFAGLGLNLLLLVLLARLRFLYRPEVERDARARASARKAWTGEHAVVGLALAALLACAAASLTPAGLALWLGGLLSAVYAAYAALRFCCVALGLSRRFVVGGGEEARPAPAGPAVLPVYTVLLPLYREANVLPRLLRSIERLDYPPDRLDVKLLIEADDSETARAAAGLEPRDWLEIVRVPQGSPKTKPRACNAGLARARGELVVVFDAEDRPEPAQLRMSVAAFSGLPPGVACLQAKLNCYNARRNALTRLFTLEYTAWFDLFLPGLYALGGPVPLGGSSNHFKTSALKALGGWDPFNVTED